MGIESDQPARQGTAARQYSAAQYPAAQKRVAAITWGAALFLLALLVRLITAWQGFLTAGELGAAFDAARFLQSLETPHSDAPGPIDDVLDSDTGVTALWAGALSVLWQRWRDPAATAAHMDWIGAVYPTGRAAAENAALSVHLTPFLLPARALMAVLTSLGVIGIYVLARGLWDSRTALIGAGLIALDPFTAALSGMLGADALAAMFIALGLLAWLSALKQESYIPGFSRVKGELPAQPDALKQKKSGLQAILLALFSGLCAGLGLLSFISGQGAYHTRFVGLTMTIGVIWVMSAILLAVFLPALRKHGRRMALLALIAVLGAVIAIFAALPPMWGDPVGTVLALWRSAAGNQATFDGSFFSTPLLQQLMLRLMPPTLIGLAISLAALLFDRRAPHEAGRRRAAYLALWAFVIAFMLALGLTGATDDRALLPVFPVLNLLAAVGWTQIADWLPVPRQAIFSAALIAVVLIAQGIMGLTGWPYILDAYNPLMGGLTAAMRVSPIGQGEGQEQVAAFLNRQPDAARLVVATTHPATFAPLFSGKTVLSSDTSRLRADAILVTAQERPAMLSPQTEAEPAFTVRIGGQEILWLYETRCLAEAEHLARYGAPTDAVLCDASTPFARQAANVYVLDGADEAEVALSLNEWSASHTRLWYLASPAASPITAASIRRQLDTFAARLDEVDLGYVTATLYILPDHPQSSSSPAFTPDAGVLPAEFGSLTCAGMAALDRGPLTADRPIRFVLRWWAISTPEANYVPIVSLVDRAGHVRAMPENGALPGSLLLDDRYWPTSAWSPGDGVERAYELALPAGLPPGPYQVQVGLADERGQAYGAAVSILDMDILPAETRGYTSSAPAANTLQLPHPQSVTWRNQLRLTGAEYPDRVTAGQTIVIGLSWLAINTFDQDYSVQFTVDLTSTQAVVQVFPLSGYPTSRWRREELIHELYDLVLPQDLDSGLHTLSLTVLDAENIPLSPPIQVGTIEVDRQ